MIFIPENQKTFTDEQFLKSVKKKIKDLETFDKALKQNNLADAKEALVKYFMTRKDIKWSKYRYESIWFQDDIIPMAEKMVEGYLFKNLNNGELKFDKFENNLNAFSGKFGVRSEYTIYLTEAYYQKKDSRYVRAFINLFTNWVTLNPFILDKNFEKDDFAIAAPGYSQLGICYSCFGLIDLICSPFFLDSEWTNEERFFVLKNLYFYMAFHLRYFPTKYRKDNHYMMERGVAPFIFGVMMSEFNNFDILLKEGRKVICKQCDDNIFEDGGQGEHCTSYQYRCLIRFMLPYSVALVNDVPLFNKAQVDKIKKCVLFQFDTAKPNGIKIDLADGNGGDIVASLTQDAPILNLGEAKYIAEKTGFDHYSINQFFEKKFAKVKSKKPKHTSAIYPNGGYVFMRDSWEADSNYLAISALTDSFYDIHLHWDTFSFFLHTKGKTLIGEPMAALFGFDNYGLDDGSHSEIAKIEARGFYFGMESHSTMVLNHDNLKSHYALGHSWGRNGIRCKILKSVLNSEFDYVHMRHREYAPSIHDRIVLNIKNDYYIMVDCMTQEIWDHSVFQEIDIRPMHYQQLIQFEFDVPVKIENDAIIAGKSDASVLIQPAPFENTVSSFWENKKLRCFEKGSVYTGSIERNRISNVIFSTLYVPFTGKNPPKAKVQILPVECNGVIIKDEIAHAISIEFESHTDYFFFTRKPGNEYSFATFSCNKEIFFARINGKISSNKKPSKIFKGK